MVPRRLRTASTTGVLALVTLAAAACSKNDVRDPFAPAYASKITIEVTNRNFNDATLHALRGGERRRLGIVTGKSGASYTLDWPSSLPLRIEIDLIAGDRCVTRELYVDPGDIVDLQIESDLRRDPDCLPYS